MRSRNLVRPFVALLTLGTWIASGEAYAQEAESPALLALDSLLNVQISTASKYDQTMREAPASVSVITAEDIERFGYRTLAEALVNEPGFYGSNDRNYFYLGMRGFSRPTDYNDRALLLLNGHRWNETFYGSAFLGTGFGISLNAVERIEIVRGPGSALYGSNAMFAVINVITKDGNTVDGLDVRGIAGSYGLRSTTATFGHSSSSGWDFIVTGALSDADGQDLYFPEFDNPQSNSGMAESLDWLRSYGGFAKVSYRGLTFSALATSRRKGVPTAPWEATFNADTRTRDDRAFLELKLDHTLGVGKVIQIRGFYDTYSYEGIYPYEPVDGGLYIDGNDNSWLGGEVRLNWDLSPNNRLTFGTELQHGRRANFLAQTDEWGVGTVGNWPFSVFSLYAQDEMQLIENLILSLGLRADHYTSWGTAVTPRAALVFFPASATALKLLYGQAYRAPDLWELHYEEEDWFETNPDLGAENIRTLEFVWEQRLAAGLFGAISLYNYRMSNLIDEVWTSPIGHYENMSQVTTNGLEAVLKGRFGPGFSGFASYTFQSAKNAGSTAYLSNSPRHLLRTGASYPVFPHFVAAINVSYDHGRKTVYRADTDSYWLTNLNFTTTDLWKHARISFKVINLFDTTYRTPGGFEHAQQGIVQDGRNFRLTFGLLF